MTDHRIPLAGVIGRPIAHSRSPRLHRHWLARYGIAGDYVPLHVEEGDLEAVLRAMPRMGFVGCNITLPHKIRALELADQVSERARLIGAANTLIFGEDGEIQADNTDGYGFTANLVTGAPDWDPAAGAAAVLGAGGAARAVIASLLEVGVPQILLCNRNRARADELAAAFGPDVHVYDWSMAGAVIAEATTVVNTTSLGMVGEPELNVPASAFGPGQVVTDLVYNPLKTRFLAVAEASGCRVVDGLGMLLHQAVPGFERWFGLRPEVDAELRAAVLG